MDKIAQMNPKLNSGFMELTEVGSGCVIWDELEAVGIDKAVLAMASQRICG